MCFHSKTRRLSTLSREKFLPTHTGPRTSHSGRMCAVAAICLAVFTLPAVVQAQSAAGTARPTPQRRAPAHPLDPAIRLARQSQASIDRIEDYTANFAKRDVVKGQMHAHSMQIKFRAEPMSVYLRFHKPHAGREVIYVAGQNQGKLLAHETGIASIVGTVALHPESAQAMSESRRPISMIGMSNLAAGMISYWESLRSQGVNDVQVQYYNDAALGEMKCVVIETKLSRPAGEVSFHISRLYIDKATGFPVRVENYGFPTQRSTRPPLMEEYTYTGIRTNVGLRDADFDTRNPAYGF